jgi:hypothetical protein
MRQVCPGIKKIKSAIRRPFSNSTVPHVYTAAAARIAVTFHACGNEHMKVQAAYCWAAHAPERTFIEHWRFD